jgi:hypothetical protein
MNFIKSSFYICNVKDGIIMFYINPYKENTSMISLYFSPNILPDFFLLSMIETPSLDIDYVYDLVNKYIDTPKCQSLISDILGSAIELSVKPSVNDLEDYRTGKDSYLN